MTRTRLRFLAPATALLLTATAGISTATASPAATVPTLPTTGTHVLTNALVAHLDNSALVTDDGELPESQTFEVSVHLQENQAAEAREFAAITDPKSPDYRHYLTRSQYVAAFGEPAALTSAVASQLTSHGLTVVYTSAPGTLIQLRGTAAQMEATFLTPLHSFTAGRKTFRANTVEPTVPAAVDAVNGLETLSAPTPAHTSLASPALASPALANLSPRKSGRLPAQGCVAPAQPAIGFCTGAITPQDLWSAYNQPSTDRGAGQQIGIIGEGQVDTVVSDLRGFEKSHGLRQVPVREVSAGDTFTSSDGEGEWALDSAATTGMAPDIDRLTYYFTDALGDDGGFSAFADDDTPGAPMQANYSVGGCESLNYALGAITAEEPIFRQMAMEGKTLFVSTGDTGGSCTVAAGNGFANTGAPMVEWPSSSDAVVGVGGTELFTNGVEPNPTREIEKAWDYTGGGSSDFIQEPSWQSAIATIVQPCAVKAVTSVGGGSFCRGLPDVAALSGDISVLAGSVLGGGTEEGQEVSQGYTDFEGATEASDGGTVTPGEDTVDGGTSLASPLWVGMWTRMQAAAGGTLGFAAPVLYSTAGDPTKDANDFFDVAIGQNFQHQALPRTTAAQGLANLDPTGWDYVSGLGVPNVTSLTQDLAGSTTAQKPVDTSADGSVTRVQAAQTAGPVCTSNGVYTDPSGDTSPLTVAVKPSAVDLTQVAYTEPVSGTIQVVDTVASLTDSADTLEFTNAFEYAGKSYELLAERDEPGDTGTNFELDSVNTGGTTNSTATLATLTGSFDNASNTVSIDLPVATFNSKAMPSTPLADGALLTGLTTTTNTLADEVIDYDDQASTACPYSVGKLTATPGLPETPYVPLLLLIGLIPAALLLKRRRSRAA